MPARGLQLPASIILGTVYWSLVFLAMGYKSNLFSLKMVPRVVCLGVGKAKSFVVLRIWGNSKGHYNRCVVLLFAFVSLSLGLGVTAPARADF